MHGAFATGPSLVFAVVLNSMSSTAAAVVADDVLELAKMRQFLERSKSAAFREADATAAGVLSRAVALAMRHAARLLATSKPRHATDVGAALDANADTVLMAILVPIRLLRNMCVQCTANQNTCQHLKALHAVGSILVNITTNHTDDSRASVDSTLAGSSSATVALDESVPAPTPPRLLVARAIVQFFANCVTHHDANQDTAWNLFLAPCAAGLLAFQDSKLNEFLTLAVLKCVGDATAAAGRRRQQLASHSIFLDFLLSEVVADDDGSAQSEEEEEEEEDEDEEDGEQEQEATSSEIDDNDHHRTTPLPIVLYKRGAPNPGWALDVLRCVVSERLSDVLATVAAAEAASTTTTNRSGGGGSGSGGSGNSGGSGGGAAGAHSEVEVDGWTHSGLATSFRSMQVLEIFRDATEEDAGIVTPAVLRLAVNLSLIHI